jgi:putative transposase
MAGTVRLSTSTTSGETTMTVDRIALRELLEKGSDADLLREMIGFVTERLMRLEVDGL